MTFSCDKSFFCFDIASVNIMTIVYVFLEILI